MKFTSKQASVTTNITSVCCVTYLLISLTDILCTRIKPPLPEYVLVWGSVLSLKSKYRLLTERYS